MCLWKWKFPDVTVDVTKMMTPCTPPLAQHINTAGFSLNPPALEPVKGLGGQEGFLLPLS